MNISIISKVFLCLSVLPPHPPSCGASTCVRFLGPPGHRPQATVGVHSLSALEARGPDSSCQRGLVPFGGSEGESVLCLSPSFWVLSGNLTVPWLVDTSFQSLSSHGLLWSVSTHRTMTPKGSYLPILQVSKHQLGVQQLKSVLTIPADSVRPHRLKAQSLKTVPTSDANCKSLFLPTGYKLGSSHDLLPGFSNLLEWLTEPGEFFIYYDQLITEATAASSVRVVATPHRC